MENHFSCGDHGHDPRTHTEKKKGFSPTSQNSSAPACTNGQMAVFSYGHATSLIVRSGQLSVNVTINRPQAIQLLMSGSGAAGQSRRILRPHGYIANHLCGIFVQYCIIHQKPLCSFITDEQINPGRVNKEKSFSKVNATGNRAVSKTNIWEDQRWM